VVLRTLYLIFTEGYAATSGNALYRPVLAAEAIRLARGMHASLPGDSEVAGLLALMVLTDARRDARVGREGEPVPMADQDRTRWDREQIAEGVQIVTAALPQGPVGPYQLQAAIAALHDEAESADRTDWPQIVALYEALGRIDPSPIVALNHAVAVAMAAGPDAGLELLEPLGSEPSLTDDHRLWSARAHLYELRGDRELAHAQYLGAADRALNLPQERYLRRRAEGLAPS
jgi:predicted RNA polymerase sigma factor